MKVIGDKVLVKVATEEEVTASGIIIATAKQERKYEGEIVAIGTSPDIQQMNLKVGDYVYYPRGLNTEIKIKDVVHDVISIYDILTVKEEEDE